MYELRPIATFGLYRNATRQRLLHLSTEFSYQPGWSSSYTLLYRRTAVDYHDGFKYRQNQFTGSFTRWVTKGNQAFSIRADISGLTSNSSDTRRNITGYGEAGWTTRGSTLGITGGGFYSSYPEEKTWGGSAGLWTVFLKRHVAGIKVNSQHFSGSVYEGKTFFSGSLFADFRVGSKGGALVSGKLGQRSLFYDPDIKLVYAITDIFRGGAGLMVYRDLSDAVQLFVDATGELYDAVEGGRYSVVYVTSGLRLRF